MRRIVVLGDNREVRIFKHHDLILMHLVGGNGELLSVSTHFPDCAAIYSQLKKWHLSSIGIDYSEYDPEFEIMTGIGMFTTFLKSLRKVGSSL